MEEKGQAQAALPAGEGKGAERNEVRRKAKRLDINHARFQVLRAMLWHKTLIRLVKLNSVHSFPLAAAIGPAAPYPQPELLLKDLSELLLFFQDSSGPGSSSGCPAAFLIHTKAEAHCSWLISAFEQC